MTSFEQVARKSHRAEVRAYIEANGESTLTEVMRGLHWTRDFARRTLAHAVDAGVLRVRKTEGSKRFAVGEADVKFPIQVKEKKVKHPERITPRTYRQQIAREILAQHERERAAYGRSA